jgi:hypothetical protein
MRRHFGRCPGASSDYSSLVFRDSPVSRYLLVVRLILVEHSLNVRSKLGQRIDHHTNPSLSDHALIAFGQHAVVVRLPRGDGDPGPKRCRVRHDLRSYRFIVCATVGDKVPHHGVSHSWPRAFAAAAVITGLESHGCIAQRRQRVLNDIPGVKRAKAFGKTGSAIAPVGLDFLGLVVYREESCLHVDPGSCVGLPKIELETLVAGERLHRRTFRDVCAIDPVHG